MFQIMPNGMVDDVLESNNELLLNISMYLKQIDFIIFQVKNGAVNKDGLLIQLEGIKAQMEMDLE